MEGIKKAKLTQPMIDQLREPFPPEAISQHANKKYLSTIKAIYVIERINSVFGIGRWNIETAIIKDDNEYVVVKGTLTVIDYDIVIPSQYGGHKTVGKGTEPADGYKSAVTDCLTKCASYLEIGIDVFKGQQTHANPNNFKKAIPMVPDKIKVDINNIETIEGLSKYYHECKNNRDVPPKEFNSLITARKTQIEELLDNENTQ